MIATFVVSSVWWVTWSIILHLDKLRCFSAIPRLMIAFLYPEHDRPLNHCQDDGTPPYRKKTMPYVRLGGSGLQVSRLVLGCFNYGDPDWKLRALPYLETRRHIKTAYDVGINTFDTSPHYSNGHSELHLGKAILELGLPRDEIVVMTKVGYYVEGPNKCRLSRKNIFDSVKQSLQRLQMDYVDVLQCPKFDYDTPISETMQALHDVVKAGYVRYIGMSTCRAYQFHIMQNYAIKHKLTRFVSMQTHYSLVYREDEHEVLPTLKHFGVGAISKSPLSANVLSAPWNAAEVAKRSLPFHGPGSEQIVGRLDQLAKQKRVAMEQVAVAWVLHKEGICCTIVNTTQLESLCQAIDSINVKLSKDDLRFLEELYQPQRPID